MRGILAQIGYSIGLNDDAMRAVAKCVTNGWLIGRKTIRGNLWRADNATTQVLDKIIRGGIAALAGAIGDDCTGRSGEPNECILVALHGHVFRRDALLLLADERP